MQSMRVTDLEEFAEIHIWGPFWPIHPEADHECKYGNPENYRAWLKRNGKRRHNLMQTCHHLRKHDAWAAHVFDRLMRIGVTFPPYIQHPLVEDVRDGIRHAANVAAS